MSDINVKEVINKMSLGEKIALCSGKSFWETEDFEQHGIPSMFMCDGPSGLRKQEGAADMLGVNKSRHSTCFPAAVTTGASWDKDLLRRIGTAIGEEARNQKVGMVLGPGACIKRNPLCGRNFEYFSEDPYLAGELAAQFIQGVESKGVGTSLKHFACNSQEYRRFTSDGVIDERTLREIYLSAFEIAVKKGRPATLMCAYPKINGVHCSDSKKLLTDILRDDWGYEGAVVTDWGAMNDRIKGFKAGCDLNMPGGAAYMEKECAAAVKNGTLSEEDVNKCAERVLKLVFDHVSAMTGEECDYDEHHSLCEEAAISGAVLLKNNDTILPLLDKEDVAVIGYMAKNMRYQGAGSAHINPMKLSQPMDFLDGCLYAQGCDEKGDTNEEMLKEAVNAAFGRKYAVVFAGLPDRYESEGFDRDNMKMPEGHIRMIEAVASANPNTVVVLMCGSAVECPWADNVKGILYMGIAGQAAGSAIEKLLFGKAVPSGRLTESWPFKYEDVPSSEIYNKTEDALYEEGIYVGYRYFDKADIKARWPFGYGLSYSSFEYSGLSVDGDKVTVNVTNTGKYDAAEIVQMYIHAPQDGIHRPLRELKGFEKVFLKTGETKTVSFVLDERSCAIWDEGWKIPGGEYEIRMENLVTAYMVEGHRITVPEWQQNSFYETCQGKPSFDEWKKLLGFDYKPRVSHKKGEYTMEDTVLDMAKDAWIMKLMCKATTMFLAKGIGTKDEKDPELKMMIMSSLGGPLRSMYISSGMKGGVFNGLLEMANGHFFRGIWRMITGQ